MNINIFSYWKFVLIALFIPFMFSCGISNHSSSLPEFHIDVNTSELNFGDYISTDVSYYDSSGLLIQKDITASIKYRGNASSRYNKKSFSIKFPGKEKFGDSDKANHWTLISEYIDKTFMRHKLSYDLFRSFSEGNCSAHAYYVEVYLNGKYHGLYTLTEKLDENKLDLKKKDPNSVLFKQPPISNPPEIHNSKYEGMVKYSKISKFYQGFSERAFNKLLKETYYNQKYPDIYDANKNYLIHEISDFIINSDIEEFSDSLLFSEFFSLNNIIDWHLLLLITNNADGIIKNFYLSRKKEGAPFLFHPWDYDHSFGRDGDGELNHNSFLDITRMKLLSRLIETDAFDYREKLFDKYVSLIETNILTVTNINSMIDSNMKMIESAAKRNELLWPVDSVEYFIGQDFTSEVELMKRWVEKQLPKVEEYLTTLLNEPEMIDVLTGKLK